MIHSFEAHSCAILCLDVLLVVMSHFVKVVFIELPHEAGEVAVLEVFREDVLCEFLVLSCSC